MVDLEELVARCESKPASRCRRLATGWSGNLHMIDADDAHQTLTLYQRVSVPTPQST